MDSHSHFGYTRWVWGNLTSLWEWIGWRRIALPSKGEVIVYGDRRDKKSCLISMIKDKRCLVKGCVGFLPYVVDAKKEKKGLESVPVVSEYPEVFPEDLTTLPPDRQVEFRIDLVPGETPIAREPYRLAQTEIREMMTQLQELLDKGFIRPSTSPWGLHSYDKSLKYQYQRFTHQNI
ncbi:hypothetical protein L6452_04025 [Arctium lappa]|uniref:Uncharacterized protein n=1 Tax=Arctium lappa TaxID=4217 RepID=A0ACB9FPS7_ARCLA|nr:hypothetical protein L6452_04025 [Arctium lappa]